MKTNSSLVNVRDPEFIKMLLPKAGQYEGLKTLVSKWEGLPSGSFLDEYYDALLKLRLRKASSGTLSLVCYAIVLLYAFHELIVHKLKSTDYVLEYVDVQNSALLFVGVISFFVWVFHLHASVPVKSKSIDELQEVIEVINGYAGAPDILFWKVSTFAVFSNIFQEHLRDRAENVFLLEKAFSVDDTNSKISKRLCEARMEMNRLSKVYKPLIGSEKAELGQYFEKVKKENRNSHVSD